MDGEKSEIKPRERFGKCFLLLPLSTPCMHRRQSEWVSIDQDHSWERAANTYLIEGRTYKQTGCIGLGKDRDSQSSQVDL